MHAKMILLAVCFPAIANASADTGRLFRTVCETSPLGAVSCYVLSYDVSRHAEWERAKIQWMPTCVMEVETHPQDFTDMVGDAFMQCQQIFAAKQEMYSVAGATADEFTVFSGILERERERCLAIYSDGHRGEVPSQGPAVCANNINWLEQRRLLEFATAHGL